MWGEVGSRGSCGVRMWGELGGCGVERDVGRGEMWGEGGGGGVGQRGGGEGEGEAVGQRGAMGGVKGAELWGGVRVGEVG